MKEYKTRNKQETKVLATVCCHNGFRSMQLKSIIDNRKGNLMSIPNSVLSCGIRQHQNNDFCFDPIVYIQQMGKDEFLSFLQHRVAKVGDMLLSQINQTTNDCPYIRKWFAYYSQKSVEDIVQAISKFAPLTQVAPSFDEYIDFLISRVQNGLQKNIDTGSIEDIPNEIKTGKERPEIFEHIAIKQNSVQLCKTVDESMIAADVVSNKMNTWMPEEEIYRFVQYVDKQISVIPIEEATDMHYYSDQFSGCLMAVFKSNVNVSGKLEDNKKYVAHVALNIAHTFEEYCNKGYFSNAYFFKPIDRSLYDNRTSAVGKISYSEQYNDETYKAKRLIITSTQSHNSNSHNEQFQDTELYPMEKVKPNTDIIKYFKQRILIYGLDWLVYGLDKISYENENRYLRYKPIRSVEKFKSYAQTAFRGGLIHELPEEMQEKMNAKIDEYHRDGILSDDSLYII